MSIDSKFPRRLLLPGLLPEERVLAPIAGEIVEQVYRHPNIYNDSYGAKHELENTVAAMIDVERELDFEEYIAVLKKVTDLAISFAERYQVLMTSLPPAMRSECTMIFERLVGQDMLVRIVPPEN